MGTRRLVYEDILQAMGSRCRYMCQATLTKQTSHFLHMAREVMSAAYGEVHGVPGVDPSLTEDEGSRNALHGVA